MLRHLWKIKLIGLLQFVSDDILQLKSTELCLTVAGRPKQAYNWQGMDRQKCDWKQWKVVQSIAK